MCEPQRARRKKNNPCISCVHVFLSVIALHTSLHLPLQSPVSVQSELLAVPPSARCSSPPVDLSVALIFTSLRMWPHPIEWRGRSLALTVTFVLVGPVSMDTLLGQITGNCFSEAAMHGQLSRSTSRSSKDSTVSPLFGSLLYVGWRQRDQASWGRCHSPGPSERCDITKGWLWEARAVVHALWKSWTREKKKWRTEFNTRLERHVRTQTVNTSTVSQFSGILVFLHLITFGEIFPTTSNLTESEICQLPLKFLISFAFL